MKSLKQIREASGGKEAYQKFFNSLLKKFGVSSPSELEGDKKKEFYDALDAGWDGDNEKPEKNERYDDPDNLDPETTHDSDEDMADKAASHVTEGSVIANRLRGPAKEVFQKALAQIKKDGIKRSDEKARNAIIDGIEGARHINDRDMRDIKRAMTYESVMLKLDVLNEALSKLIAKAGRGKLAPRDAIDIDYMGDRKDIKFDSTKWKINIKGKGDGQAFVSGDKKKIIAWLTSDDYGMDDEDIEDLFPELLEGKAYPKPLSVIRKWSGDAASLEEEAYKMNEKMVMCEHCGKMHEEGACEVSESEIHLNKLRAAKFAPKSKWAALKKKFNVTVDKNDPRWVAGKPKDLHKFAMAMGMSKNDIKKTYNHITPEYKGASNITNKQRDESVEEANRFSKKLNKPSKKIFDLALAAIRRNNITDKKEKDEYVDDVAGVSLTPKEVELVKKAIKLESVEEAFSMRSIGLKGASKRSRDKARGKPSKAKEMPPMKGAKLGKAYPALNRTQENEIHKIAAKHAGDMEAAIKEIEKMRVWKGRGIQDHPYVLDVLRRANESVNEAMSKGQMAHDKEYMHKKLKGNNDKSTKVTTAKALKIKVDGDTLVLTPKQDKLMKKHKVTIRNDKDGDISVWGKGDDVHKFLGAMGMRTEDVNEGVNVDRRTKGFKEALKRQEAAKIKREKAKAKKEKKKHQAELDARYDYDGEVDTVLAAANSVMFGKKLPEDAAANNAGDGGVDMAPNMGKKKKKKELLARRSY